MGVTSKQLIKITHYPRVRAQSVQTVTKQQVQKNQPPKVQKVDDLPNGLTQAMVDNPLSVDYVESFECISKEIEYCQQQILKQQGKNCQYINDRMQSLQTNKSILEAQVSSGLLSLEDYTNRIKRAMIIDLTLAKYLKSKDRKLEAVRVLQRYKMMKKEIEGGG